MAMRMSERRAPVPAAPGEGLRAAGVTVRFGGLTAVDGAGLTAPPGAVTGLLGPDGAGKTTLCDVICGLRRPAFGSVRLDGADLLGRSPGEVARRGVARTFHRPPPPRGRSARRTLRDAVQAAAEAEVARREIAGRDRLDARRRRRDALARTGETADALLDRLGIAEFAAHRAGAVPPEVARLAELAGALAARPRALVLDEPSTGLGEAAARSLEVLLRDLAAEGLAVVLVERDLERVLGVCDTVHVLSRGRVVACGPPAEVRCDRFVRTACAG
ncbi:ATP-binding cassette domain-containing protein [Actinomadura oligospora]|uniref:ATP-binding cassette domain-containing protein n=1 Tax=Actinomadura oligospora TaxID=111804 RepID=UPI0004B919BB|nr:ATP-binding cassette domain-containing protein [Actinomadura oligospora]